MPRTYCDECGLSNPIFDTSETTGKLFFVRMQPTWQSNKRRIPFVDPGGQMLRDLIKDTTLQPHAYYTYLVHCFRFQMAPSPGGFGEIKKAMPPKRKHKILCYKSYMLDALAMRDPDFVVAFGRPIFERLARIKDARGIKWGTINDDQEVPIMLMRDPNWVLSHPNGHWHFEQRLRKIRDYFGAAPVGTSKLI